MPLEPLPWQRLFLSKYASTRPTDFLLVACPGAGKTLAAGFAVLDLLREGEIERILIVVPTYPLREQWSRALERLGLVIDGITSNSPFGEMETLDGSKTHGWAITYQSLFADRISHRLLNSRKRTVVILDEVHHLADGAAWGEAAIEALGPCVRRLALSGTPFKTDGSDIPFTEMIRLADGTRECRYRDDPDGTPYPYAFDYSYGAALVDKPSPVRPVIFEHYDGDVEWMDGSLEATIRSRVSDAIKDRALRRKTNRHVLNPAGDWLNTVLAGADDRLSKLQAEGDDRAKGLVVCYDTAHADQVAERLRAVSRGRIYTAVSLDRNGKDVTEEAREVIENFGQGDGRWLVAVQMVTEGIDIPELRVEVYATTVRSRLFFLQTSARVLRRRRDLPEELDQTAYVFIPKDPEMLQLANEIQEQVRAAVLAESDDDDENEPLVRRTGNGGTPSLPFPDDFQNSTADDPGLLVPGRGDLGVTTEMVRQIAEQSGQPFGVAASVLAAFLQSGQAPSPSSAPPPDEPARRPKDRLSDRRRRLDGLIKQLTNAVMQRDGLPYSEYSKTIALLKTQIYSDVGIYTGRMTAEEKKHAYERADTPVLDAAITLTKKMLSEL